MKTIICFFVSVGFLLLLMWSVAENSYPYKIDPFQIKGVIGVVGLLICFGITYGWIKHSFFNDED